MDHIVNMTATFSLNETLRLEELKDCCFTRVPRTKPRRERQKNAFNVACWRHPRKNITFLLYASGRVVILGARTFEDIDDSAEWICKILNMRIDEPIKVSNMVVKLDLEKKLELEKFVRILRMKGREVTYETELSPALIYELRHGKALVFASGKVIITGLRSKDQVEQAIEQVTDDFLQ